MPSTETPWEAPTLHSVKTHESLSQSAAALPLVEHAIARFGSEKAMYALAALPGLCAWVSETPMKELLKDFGHDAAEAVMAIALDRPPPGLPLDPEDVEDA